MPPTRREWSGTDGSPNTCGCRASLGGSDKVFRREGYPPAGRMECASLEVLQQLREVGDAIDRSKASFEAGPDALQIFMRVDLDGKEDVCWVYALEGRSRPQALIPVHNER
jgi:hypothetical protein